MEDFHQDYHYLPVNKMILPCKFDKLAIEKLFLENSVKTSYCWLIPDDGWNRIMQLVINAYHDY
jgi:hypothetical protein